MLKKLREANKIRQTEWDSDDNISLTYSSNELAGEVGELCNIIKKLERERLGLVGSRATIEQAEEELADVIICCDLLANRLGIDLSSCIPKKFNKTSEKYGLKTRM